MISPEAPAIEGRQRVLDALRALWRAIQQRHEQVPDVLMAWGSGGRRGRTAGVPHLHGGIWSGELTITDTLTSDPAALGKALLHDAVHALADARGITDTSNNGRYHNHRYATLAGELGLDVSENSTWGWSETQPADTTLAHYATELAALHVAAEQYVPGEPPPPPGRGRNNVVAICGCTGTAARPFRIAPSKLALGPITCGVCGQAFRERPDTAG